MKRSLTALLTLICLLASLTAIPAAPTLVCRFTGQPMALPTAAEQEAAAVPPCCQVASVPQGDENTPSLVLSRPGCCDLRSQPDRTHPRYTIAARVAADLPLAGPLVPPAFPSMRQSARNAAPPALPCPPFLSGAPPPGAVGSRAPPVFS